MDIHNVKITSSMMKNGIAVVKAGETEIKVDGQKLNPLQLYFCGLASCMTSIALMTARMRRIEMRKFDVTVDADIDYEGLMGKNPDLRAGFEKINVTVDMDCDLTHEEKVEFIDYIEKHCPVADNTVNQSNVVVKF